MKSLLYAAKVLNNLFFGEWKYVLVMQLSLALLYIQRLEIARDILARNWEAVVSVVAPCTKSTTVRWRVGDYTSMVILTP